MAERSRCSLLLRVHRKMKLINLKVTTWFRLIITTRLGCTSYLGWPCVPGDMFGLVARWQHSSHKREPLHQTLEYQGEQVCYLIRQTLTPDPKDWGLYSHTWGSYRICNRYLMATGRVRFHIWRFRPKDHHLGKSNVDNTRASCFYPKLDATILNLDLALYPY